MMTDPQDTIRAFVAEAAGGEQFADDDDIFASGRINSLFAVQLVMWVENTFGITVQGADLNMDNFRTIGDLARFVSARTAPPADVAAR